MNLEEALNFRRSVRRYITDKNLDTDKVMHCIELATLAPNSSNMQLWEFYHITDREMINKLAHASFGQPAVSTANQLVVFVTRQDLHRHRAKQNIGFEQGNIIRNSPADSHERRIKARSMYYNVAIPFLYARFFGLLGLFRKLLSLSVTIFRPMFIETLESEQRAVLHKSCALAAQTFMIAMAEEGYDTCPVEGFDSIRVRKLLKLPCAAEINMIVSCGYRDGNKGIWGERFRVPFDEVYRNI
jgi:nitroreductase